MLAQCKCILNKDDFSLNCSNEKERLKQQLEIFLAWTLKLHYKKFKLGSVLIKTSFLLYFKTNVE